MRILLLLASLAQAEVKNNVQLTGDNVMGKNLPTLGVPTLRVNRGGTASTFIVLESGENVALTESMISSLVASLHEKAKDAACRLPKETAPAQVEATAGFLSFRWYREELCGKK